MCMNIHSNQYLYIQGYMHSIPWISNYTLIRESILFPGDWIVNNGTQSGSVSVVISVTIDTVATSISSPFVLRFLVYCSLLFVY